MTRIKRCWCFVREYATFYALGFLIMVALKVHYCRATSDQLDWVLSPTAQLVETMAGIHFEKEAQIGFMSRESRLILVPSCAGVNFLIISFCAFCMANIHRLRGGKAKLVWIGVSLATSYLLTVVVNAFRIILSAFLYRADIYGGWITPDRVHRLEGTVVYFVCVVLLYLLGEQATSRVRATSCKSSQDRETGMVDSKLHYRSNVPLIPGEHRVEKVRKTPSSLACSLGIPFTCYLLVAMGIPILNGAWRQNSMRFVEHCLMVPATCVLVLLFLFLVVAGWRKIAFVFQKTKGSCLRRHTCSDNEV